MRVVAWVGGLVVVAGLIFMAVAGFSGAIPILVSAAALVAMIGLGSTMGGRHTANVAPVTTAGRPPEGTDTAPPDTAPPDTAPPAAALAGTDQADTALADEGADGAPAGP